MKPLPAIPCPMEHRRSRLLLYWSQGNDGDMIAHVRFARELNGELKEPCDSNHDNRSILTDDKSATRDFRIATASAGPNLMAFPPVEGFDGSAARTVS